MNVEGSNPSWPIKRGNKMANWHPNLYLDLGGSMIGCPKCTTYWGILAFYDLDMSTNFLSIEEALSIRVRCGCGWEGQIEDLQELQPGGWDTIIKWWEKALNYQDRSCIRKRLIPVNSKNVEESLKEQRNNNLREIFG